MFIQCFLPFEKKTERTYVLLFNTILSLVGNLSKSFKKTDLALGSINALQRRFLSTQIEACQFHRHVCGGKLNEMACL